MKQMKSCVKRLPDFKRLNIVILSPYPKFYRISKYCIFSQNSQNIVSNELDTIFIALPKILAWSPNDELLLKIKTTCPNTKRNVTYKLLSYSL